MKSGTRILIPLLFLSLVMIHEAQGMRLILPNTQHSMSHQQAIVEMSNEEVNSVWKSKHFSGRARKLMNTSPIPTTTTIDKNEKVDKNKEKTATKEESLSVESSSYTAEHRQPATDETYPDILDIAGMDYSQARRKPPIHN